MSTNVNKAKKAATPPATKAGRKLSFQEAKARAVKQYGAALAKLAK
jgi:hypothetical protein